jgi:hypothetical protein
MDCASAFSFVVDDHLVFANMVAKIFKVVIHTKKILSALQLFVTCASHVNMLVLVQVSSHNKNTIFSTQSPS